MVADAARGGGGVVVTRWWVSFGQSAASTWTVTHEQQRKLSRWLLRHPDVTDTVVSTGDGVIVVSGVVEAAGPAAAVLRAHVLYASALLQTGVEWTGVDEEWRVNRLEGP